MKNRVSTIGLEIKEKLGLKFFPLGMYYADRMTLTMPWEMAVEIHGYLDNSFVITDTWKKIKERN